MATANPTEQKHGNEATASKSSTGLSTVALAMSLVMGTFFGIVLTKSEVVRNERFRREHDDVALPGRVYAKPCDME